MISNTYNKIAAVAPARVYPSTRMVFFDNLKVLMMIMVIVHHVGQAYGPTGGWWPIQEATRARILSPFFMVNRSFGMSLFFMIAGYFTALLCEKKGFHYLVRSRLLHLGIPLLIYSLFMIFLQVFVFGYLVTGELGKAWPIDVAHFWFVQHLLVYSLVYVAWQRLFRKANQQVFRFTSQPGYGSLLVFAICLTVATAIVRTWFDTDEWIYLFGYFRIAPADVPRDLGLFLIGTFAYRNDWLNRFPSKVGWGCLMVGFTLMGLWFGFDLWVSGFFVFSDTVWGLLLPFWESLLCCSMCFGLTIVFRDKVNIQTPLALEMGKSTYATYMIHVFVIIFFQSLFLGLATTPLIKFFLVSLVSIPASFLLASLIRRPLRL